MILEPLFVVVARKTPTSVRWYWGSSDTSIIAWTRNKKRAHAFALGNVREVKDRLIRDYCRTYSVFEIESIFCDEEIVLDDLRTHGEQTAQDFDAILRFAEATAAPAPVIAYIKAVATHEVITRYSIAGEWELEDLMKAAARIDRRRKRALQYLVKSKLAAACWVGGGEGSVNRFEANRAMHYDAIRLPDPV